MPLSGSYFGHVPKDLYRNNFPIFMRSNKESRKTGRSANRDSCFPAFLMICGIGSVEVHFREVISGQILMNASGITSRFPIPYKHEATASEFQKTAQSLALRACRLCSSGNGCEFCWSLELRGSAGASPSRCAVPLRDVILDPFRITAVVSSWALCLRMSQLAAVAAHLPAGTLKDQAGSRS